ncbi:MAG: hypothetical protein NTY53_09130 [Kiritimatiellaeota bacterium]|nr:hypothetical protein [Kiritimatiellota bacterium]
MKTIIAIMVLAVVTAGAQQTNTLVQTQVQAKASAPFRPKTYVDETRGATGIGVVHTVTFNVEQVRQAARLTFWASGAIGLDTYGRVTLTAQGQEAQLIYNWKPKDFKKPASAANTYKDLKSITCDISKLVKKPGPYEVTFKWTNGAIGLHILRVELDIK